MKTCFKCKESKPFAEFYKHKEMADGYLGKCKECTKIDVKNNRATKGDYYREFDRKRYMEPQRVAGRDAYHRSPAGKETSRKSTERYKAKNPDKRLAHGRLNDAIRDGRIQKQPCEVCGASKWVHGHHEDYALPLQVKWLCPKHHFALHREQGD